MASTKVVLTGSSSGLGAAILREMEADCGFNVLALNKDNLDLAASQEVVMSGAIEAADIAGFDRVDCLINCAGVNHIDWLENLTEEKVSELMAVNTYSLLYMAQALLPRMRGGTILNVVSNAYRVPMTHSWIYNASKGASAIATRQMARELQKTHDVCVFGICPNKLSGTFMSNYIDKRVCQLRGWSESDAQRYQLAGLVPGFETKPEWIAELVVWLLKKPHRHKYLSGCLLELGF